MAGGVEGSDDAARAASRASNDISSSLQEPTPCESELVPLGGHFQSDLVDRLIHVSRLARNKSGSCGAVAEWSKALAWKVSMGQKLIEGSNPSRSAMTLSIINNIFPDQA